MIYVLSHIGWFLWNDLAYRICYQGIQKEKLALECVYVWVGALLEKTQEIISMLLETISRFFFNVCFPFKYIKR